MYFTIQNENKARGVVSYLNKCLGTNFQPDYIDNPHAHYQNFTQADLTNARSALGYEPRFPLEEGVRDYMSRRGFLVSSAVVEMASKPMKAKKMMAAPLITPAKPFGTYGCQFVGCTKKAPNEMKNTTTATLIMTIIVFVFALSRIP